MTTQAAGYKSLYQYSHNRASIQERTLSSLASKALFKVMQRPVTQNWQILMYHRHGGNRTVFSNASDRGLVWSCSQDQQRRGIQDGQQRALNRGTALPAVQNHRSC
jgi:hypothetical protein